MSGVGGRDPGAEVARKQERAGRAGGYCLLGDLSSNTSRQATRPGHQAWGQTRAFYPYPWGQPPAPVEIKNSLYYTSHSVLPWPPSSPPPLPAKPSIRSSPFLLPLSSRSAALSLSLSSHPACRPCSSASFNAADRLNMRPAIPDGTNIIKVRPHAKPVKYRCSLSPFPHAPRLFSSAPFRPFTSSTLATGLLLSASSLYSRR